MSVFLGAVQSEGGCFYTYVAGVLAEIISMGLPVVGFLFLP